MSNVFGRQSEVGRRIKDIEKSLSTIDSEIRSLSRGLEKEERKDQEHSMGRRSPQKRTAAKEERGAGHGSEDRQQRFDPDSGSLSEREDEPGGADRYRENGRTRVAKDQKLMTYLASKDFQPSRPLRHQRRIQRNRAIVLLIVAGILLVWLLGNIII